MRYRIEGGEWDRKHVRSASGAKVLGTVREGELEVNCWFNPDHDHDHLVGLGFKPVDEKGNESDGEDDSVELPQP